MKTAIYYTDNNIEHDLMIAVQKNLLKALKGIPLISVSQKPIDFGKNICVGEKERSGKSIFEQILVGLDAAEDSVIYLCEHDVAYHSNHFRHIPVSKTTISYNRNRLQWAIGNPNFLLARGRNPLSQLIAYKNYLKECVLKMLSSPRKKRCATIMLDDENRHYFRSKCPNVDIRHGLNYSRDSKYKKQYYIGNPYKTRQKLKAWGTVDGFLNKIEYKVTNIPKRYINYSKTIELRPR